MADGVKVWDMKVQAAMLPNETDTHYFCHIIKAPDTEAKHQIIGVSRN